MKKKLKLISFILTVFIEFLLIVALKLLDNFNLILMILACFAVVGVLITLNRPKKSKMQEMGLGVLWGSLASLVLTMSFVIWLSFNFPK